MRIEKDIEVLVCIVE